MGQTANRGLITCSYGNLIPQIGNPIPRFNYSGVVELVLLVLKKINKRSG